VQNDLNDYRNASLDDGSTQASELDGFTVVGSRRKGGAPKA
jgi:hypothetical protein